MISAEFSLPSGHLGATYFSLGESLEAQGKVDDAIRAYQQALQVTPDLGVAHGALGRLLREQGQREAAIAHYKKAIDQDPQQW
ncbi:MAG: tetratricopeptide repeat protein, partial [Halothece sp. Uz-M2-17]|nr:tetratricopeptide repeat protein [Halothece sp. Uz-M2-17]